MIGDKYQGKSHELVTKLKPKIKCQAYFSSPEPLKSASLLGNETALPLERGVKPGSQSNSDLCVHGSLNKERGVRNGRGEVLYPTATRYSVHIFSTLSNSHKPPGGRLSTLITFK
jgi:hypothetical protein